MRRIAAVLVLTFAAGSARAEADTSPFQVNAGCTVSLAGGVLAATGLALFAAAGSGNEGLGRAGTTLLVVGSAVAVGGLVLGIARQQPVASGDPPMSLLVTTRF